MEDMRVTESLVAARQREEREDVVHEIEKAQAADDQMLVWIEEEILKECKGG